MVFLIFLGVWERRGAVLGRSCGRLKKSWGGLEASWGVLVRSWGVLCGLGASSGGLGAVLARLGGQKRRECDLRIWERVRAAMSEALGDPISNDYFILLND